MSLQLWTLLHIASLFPILLVLLRVLRIPSSEAKVSRGYYALSLLAIMIWTGIDFGMRNLPPEAGGAVNGMNRLGFVVVSLAVFFFVTSSVYLTRTPANFEGLFLGAPLLVIAVANLVDPFAVALSPYGWDGDIANPILRYGWLGVTSGVVLYSFARLSQIRRTVRDPATHRRFSFYMGSGLLALVMGVFFYLLAQVVEMPSLSPIAVSFSLLLAYPAFSPPRVWPETHWRPELRARSS